MKEFYIEMGKGMRTGIVQADFIEYGLPIRGDIKLEDFAKHFLPDLILRFISIIYLNSFGEPNARRNYF
jgi:hypothetical protein